MSLKAHWRARESGLGRCKAGGREGCKGEGKGFPEAYCALPQKFIMVWDGLCLLLSGLLHRAPQLPARCSRVKGEPGGSIDGADRSSNVCTSSEWG